MWVYDEKRYGHESTHDRIYMPLLGRLLILLQQTGTKLLHHIESFLHCLLFRSAVYSIVGSGGIIPAYRTVGDFFQEGIPCVGYTQLIECLRTLQQVVDQYSVFLLVMLLINT